MNDSRALYRQPGDRVIKTWRPSAFFRTDLEANLFDLDQTYTSTRS